jgi:hypothetical protein
MVARRKELWVGSEPQIHPPMPTTSHGAVFTGLWHRRMLLAWHHAWNNRLIDQVVSHGGGMYTVPSQTQADTWYAVWRYPLAPDGYLYICDCAASERGGAVCAHGMAVYLWRLKHVHNWLLKPPLGGAA